MATHTGMTTDEFVTAVNQWLASARHPRFKRPYTDLVYQPMQELLTYLRANGFKTYIVSGGTVDFMRVFAQRVYGIPPEQVVSTTFVTRFAVAPNGIPNLVIEPKLSCSATDPASPRGSTRSSAAGRSSRSATPMATSRCWSGRMGGPVPGSWVSCKRWVVVNMKSDWKVVYPFQR